MTMCEKLGFKSVVQYKGVSMNVDMDAVVEEAERQIKKTTRSRRRTIKRHRHC